jgi:hypothetical protein
MFYYSKYNKVSFELHLQSTAGGATAQTVSLRLLTAETTYSGRKINASFGNVTVRGGKRRKWQKGGAMANSLSMYSITKNIYYSQLSSTALLLQPETNCFTLYNTRKRLGSLSLCAIVLRSSLPSHVSTCNGQRSSQLFCVHYTSISISDFLGMKN